MDKHLRRGLGFTLIELMLVASIVGLLAAIAVPKFANLIVKAKEAAVLGKLGAFRSTISIYYSDNEGRFPGNSLIAGFGANFILAPKYMDGPITISLPTVPIHKSGNYVTSWVDPDYSSVLGFKSYGQILSGSDDYPWAYNYATGHLTVHCTHTSSRGLVWSSY
jgi:prepilin-type N-terminal cleavage/methylation domain-containing protein